MREPAEKILSRETMAMQRKQLRDAGLTLVFTNGCFDILHAGHADYLAFARRQGNALLVGLNSDQSIKRNKGQHRPINTETNRALMLAALEAVDYVVVFNEDKPEALIEAVLPDVLVKGEDWAHYVSGREIVERNGGRVVLAPLKPGLSTTNTIERILAAERGT